MVVKSTATIAVTSESWDTDSPAGIEMVFFVSASELDEVKNKITTLSQTVTDADGVILATTVEWLGMGGYMQEFLDSCWLYTDKSKVSGVYMFPVVMSKAYGEKEVLYKIWDIHILCAQGKGGQRWHPRIP